MVKEKVVSLLHSSALWLISFAIAGHGYNDAIIDSKIEIGEDSFLMTSEHPGKLSEGLRRSWVAHQN